MKAYAVGSFSVVIFDRMKSPHGFRPARLVSIFALGTAAFGLLPAGSAAEPPTARLINIATRVTVGGQAGTPIPGFVVGGTGSRQVLVRAVGPALGSFGVGGVLADPKLSLISGSATIASNDNWVAADGALMAGVGAFALPAGSRDAALVGTLAPAAYTAPVATDTGSGVALVEVYDAGASSTSYFVNASTRAFVGTGDNVLIPGFVIGGSGSVRLLIRAVGPTLSSFGVGGVLADPTITLYQGANVLANNDNWSSASNAAEIASTAATFGAFALPNGSRDAALLATLPAGSYSAVISGVNNTTGTALVELYSEEPARSPTPSTPGFAISSITSGPTVPTYVDAVTVTAQVQPPTGARVTQVRLNYTVAAPSAQAPVALTMFDDGQHGDGAAGDGLFGATIPVQAASATVTYTISATDSNGGTATAPSAAYLVSPTLTDTTFTSPEFLGIPTQQSVTLNLEASKELQLYVEYGTASGTYTGQTPVVTYPTGAPIELKIQSSNPQAPLQANRRYYYRVRYRAPGETAYRSRGERSFQTQRPKGQSFVFTITADPHLDENTNPAVFQQAMRNIRADNPDFNVDLGDIFMSDKLASIIPGIRVNYGYVEWRAITLRNLFAEFCHSAPFFYTLGNHEGEYGYVFAADTSATKDNNVASWNLRARKLYYPTPVPDTFYTGSTETKVILGKTELLENYYAWEWGEALMVVLDPYNNTMSNPNSPADNWKWSLGKQQYDWLKQTLQNSRARYKFLFIHHLVGGTASGRGGVETAGRYEWGGKNADNSEGFAEKRPGWDMPIHQLLRNTKVSAIFHGHDHFYGYQQLDGIVYQECPQPGTGNFTTPGSAQDGEYVQGIILPNSGHLRLTVSLENTKVEYVRAALPTQETATLKNRGVAHSYTIAPAN